MEFSRQEYWSGLPFPSPGNLPNPGTESQSPAWLTVSLPSEPPGKPSRETQIPNSRVWTTDKQSEICPLYCQSFWCLLPVSQYSIISQEEGSFLPVYIVLRYSPIFELCLCHLRSPHLPGILICIFLYTYIYTYIYIHTYTHTHTHTHIYLHGCSSKAQPLFLTLEEGYLLTAAPPDLEHEIAPLGPPVPAQPTLLGRGVAPLGRSPWPQTWGSSSRLPPLTSDMGSWTVKKAERQRIDAFELWCWRRLLRVPWTARRSNQSILKEIIPGCSLEGPMLKLKCQYFGHLMRRVDSLEKTLMLGGIGGRRRRGRQRRDGWMASPTRWTWVWVNSGSWWWTGRPGVLRFMGSQRVGHNWPTELNWTEREP